MNWVDQSSNGDSGYFRIQEGDNRIQLLSHCAQYNLKWNGSRYEPAQEGDENVSVKGVCWVLQDGVIKSATLPYTIIKSIRQLMNDQDYMFTSFPMPRVINIKAVGAGTKEVEYSVIPAPKESPVPAQTLTELSQKPTPEDMVEKMRASEAKRSEVSLAKDSGIKYPDDEMNPDDVPF